MNNPMHKRKPTPPRGARSSRRLLSCVFVLASSLGLLLFPGSGRAAVLLDRVVAVVNEEIILESEVNQAANQSFKAELGDVDLATPEGQRRYEAHRRKMLDMLIERLLVAQKAKDLKIDVTEDDVRTAAESVRTQNNLTEEQFAEALKQQGFATIADYKKAMRKQLLQLKVINQEVRSRVTVGDDEVRSYYAQSVRQAAGDQMQVHLRQIFLSIPPNATTSQADEKRRIANQILTELRGGQDFTAMAKKYGDDAASKAGGDLGWLQRGDLPTELREPVASMDAGDLRGPISSERGLHILQLIEKKSGEVKPFEEAKEDLRRQLYDQNMEKAIQNYTKELRRKAHIDLRTK
jgi:parvulin-like peptidyl-prolyl isomerase